MKTSRDIMKSIRDNWKLDALQECNDKYFYSFDDVNSILSNDKCYVIGRKGMGKTAMCQHVLHAKSYNHFAEKLSFKNFPFNELYALQDNEYTAQSQYISLWKYLIYSSVCKMMSTNENIEESTREVLLQLYPKNSANQLSRKIKEWTSLEFGLDVLGSGGNFKVERDIQEKKTLTWIEKIDLLEDIICNYCDESKYYIIFDELDEDYTDVYNQNNIKQYDFLLTGLFKAVQDVKTTFRDTKLNIMPIVFLRDDIYTRLNDADKNKWSDFKIDLDWNTYRIKQLLAFRISKDAEEPSLSSNFKEAWNTIFEYGQISYGGNQGKLATKFDFICNSTYLRPRDFIKYIQACCKLSLEKGEKYISNETIKNVDREFSNYFLSEICDEIYPILPDIKEIFNILSNIRKQLIKPSEFMTVFCNKVDDGTIKENNAQKVLKILFDFSIIGNQHVTLKSVMFFRYLHTNMTYNPQESIVIHRGLLKALQIF